MRSSSTLPIPQPNSAPPTPTRLTGANSDMEEEERGDLIQFYNSVYVKQIRDFALRYVPGVPGTAGRLREINNMIKTGETPTKKRSISLEDGSESPAKRICQENQNALFRRLQDVANDRSLH
ncbi:RBL2 protein, partial [Polypterus senegalus]